MAVTLWPTEPKLFLSDLVLSDPDLRVYRLSRDSQGMKRDSSVHCYNHVTSAWHIAAGP